MYEVVKVTNGVLTDVHGDPIERPSVFISGEEDLIYRWGSYDILSEMMSQYAEEFKKYSYVMSFEVYELTGLPVEIQWYVINRMMNFTATGFIHDFATNVCEYDDMEWLKSEMKNVPLERG